MFCDTVKEKSTEWLKGPSKQGHFFFLKIAPSDIPTALLPPTNVFKWEGEKSWFHCLCT